MPPGLVGPLGRWDNGAMSEPAASQRRYRTRGGITIHRSDRETAVGPAAADLVERLDRYPGVFMSSCFEFPGRYTRWDLGFAAPPLAITCRGRDFEVTDSSREAGSCWRPSAPPSSRSPPRRRWKPTATACTGTSTRRWKSCPRSSAAGSPRSSACCGRSSTSSAQRRGPAFRPLRRLRLRPRPPVRAGGPQARAPGRPARPGALRAG